MITPDLKECREKLDGIDREIVRLFEERMAVCGQVAEYKIETGKAVYDGERESRSLPQSGRWQRETRIRRRWRSCSHSS